MNRIVPGVTGALLAALVLTSPVPTLAATAAMPSDFNGDGYADLAISAFREAVGAKYRAGAVTVIYGSEGGLTTVGAQRWDQDQPGIKGVSRRNELFGSALATGDFDADGFADLAIGVPNDKDTGLKHAGAVNVLYGSASGLSPVGDQRWWQENLPDASEPGDHLGASLASGDFDHDGYSDLAIGVPEEDVDASADAGLVEIVYGGPDGLSSVGAATLTRAAIDGPVDPWAHFGYRLAAGDFDGDLSSDLAIGEPWLDGGEVGIVYGDPGDVGSSAGERWSQDTPGILGESADGGNFGIALTSGDFDANGVDDLAIGAPYDRVSTCGESGCLAGGVAVLYGTTEGLSAFGNQLWTQDSAGVPGTAGDEWLFGRAVASGDFDGDGADELAIGAPADGLAPLDEDIGTVTVLPGSPTGLTATGSLQWTQDAPGVPGQAAEGMLFGWSLASHNLGHSARVDLAIGALGDQRVVVLFGTSTGLSSTNAEIWSQDTPGIPGTWESEDEWGWTFAP